MPSLPAMGISPPSKMRSGIAIALITLLFWHPQDIGWQSNWIEKWGIVVAGFGLMAIWKTKFRHWMFPAFLSWYFLRSVHTAFFTQDGELTELLRLAAMSQICLLFCFVAFLNFKITLVRWLCFVAQVVLAGICYAAITSSARFYVPFLQNPSTAATFVVLAADINPISLIAIALCRSWMAAGCFVAGTLFRYRKSILGQMGAFIAALAIGCQVYFKGIPGNGRLEAWHDYLTWWVNSGWRNVVFGVGPGTGRHWIPYASLDATKTNHVHLVTWLHCDWLQSLTELGVIGGILMVGSAAMLFYYSSEKQRPVLIAYAVAMMGNFPTHLALPALVGWSLIAETNESN